MTRALVTGATGFVGANLARRLLADGHEVHLLVRPGHAAWRIDRIRNDVRLHELELADRDRVSRVMSEVKPRWIFHLAAHGAYASQRDVDQIVATNVLGTVALVEACARVGFDAFVHTGSSSEYGFKDHAPAEDEWLDPNSHYAVTKAAATHWCRFTARSRDLPITTLRLYSAYGPWEEPTRLMPTLVVRGLGGVLPPLVNPDVARDYVDVDDVVEACLLAATKTGGARGSVYNVGTGVQTSLRQVVEVARRVLRLDVEPVWGSMPDRSWDTSVWVADDRRISAELGWAPRHTFADGFARLAAWLRDDPALLRFYQSRIG